MKFTYYTVNDALNKHHPNLSGYWTTLDWDEHKASATYMMEDGGPDEIATVDRQGKVQCSQRLLDEMDAIG